MNEVKRILNGIDDFRADMDRIFADQGLTCDVCGHWHALRPGEAGRYITRGWPKCCGRTMRLVSLRKEYTAGELAGDWWWIAAGFGARLVRGRVAWEEVSIRPSGKTRIARVTNSLHQINRYVSSESRMVLVRPD